MHGFYFFKLWVKSFFCCCSKCDWRPACDGKNLSPGNPAEGAVDLLLLRSQPWIFLFFFFSQFFSFLSHFWIQCIFSRWSHIFFRQLVKYFLEDMFCFLRIIGNFKAHVFQYWRSHPCICGRQKLWFITLGFWKSVSLRLTFFSYYYLRHVSNIIHRLISKSAFFKASETMLSKCTSLKQMKYRCVIH